MSFGLYGSLYSGVSGLGAQSTAMGVISDNIANVNTVGYKAKNTNFLSMVTDSGSTSVYAPGGVRASVQQLIDRQGLVQATASPLDIAVSGNGFFVVQPKVAGSDEVLYTRAGSFVPDDQGNLRNAAGFYLQGWRLDPAGRLPGEPGNVINTTSSADISSLETVNVSQISGTAAATTEMNVAVNLDADGDVYTGATSTSTATTGIAAASDLIAGGVIAAGETVTLSDGINTVTFTAGTGAGEFSTLDQLADLVNANGNFTATVGGTASSANISIAAFDPRRSLTVTGTAGDGPSDLRLNGGAATSTSAATTGISASSDLMAGGVIAGGETVTLSDGVNTATFTAGTGAGQFSTLDQLADLVNADGNFTATIGGTTTAATISIAASDPSLNLTVSGTAGDGAPDLRLNGAFASTAFASTYDASSATQNMSSGTVPADFSRSVRLYDAQGRGHDVMVNFLMVGNNEWAVEINAIDQNDVVTTAPTPAGQIAAGVVTFNPDGTLNTISTSLSDPLEIDWANGAGSSEVTVDWGTAGPVGVGLADGLRAYSGDFEVRSLTQNGASSGELSGITIDEDGFVIASFSNGQQKQLYKVPVATFASPQNLEEKNGNVFAKTDKSGDFNLRESGSSGAGLIAPSSLEASNVDLASEFTDMIITQRAYSASSKIITTVDEMLQELLSSKR
ncbi:flagellar hook-basal body complex protein [Tistrella bauzanensis]|uniref:flagellar hook-basal body complex protein n=1 Tax=Tistrella TaxID=171436 RepID=UPI0031F721A4